MQTWDNVRFALRALRDNKLRTWLTTLGVIIGVAAVVAAIGIGQSAFGVVLESVGGLGSNLLFVIPGNPQTRFGPGTFTGSVTSLTLDDNQAILKQTRGLVTRSAPAVRKPLQVAYTNKKWLTFVAGVLPDYEMVNNHHVRRGRFITVGDSETRARVAVVGRTVIQNLFGSGDAVPLGQEIEVNRVRFTIVGVLEKKGALFSSDQDDIVMVPLLTAMRRVFNQNYLNFISLECVSPDVMDLAAERIGYLLRRRHRLRPPFPDNDDFAIRSQASALETLKTISSILTTVLAGIAAISLTVGGIGIMNIMLVSVTERTREIGIRKALGATQKVILQQFLVESALISLLGGLIGLALGIGLVTGVSQLFGWRPVVSMSGVVVALGVSVAIGIFFGIWPAKKAARLNPIDALRRE
jgi:putative ABC transport system permease protein